jgi:predicted Zn finger-like uncharacterized protein
MRLTCPNCGAQYEVPDDVIPAEGRDVQCSNCGDTWFQAHADALLPDDAPTEIRQSTADEAQETPAADPIDQGAEAFDEVEPPEVNFDEDAVEMPDLAADDPDLGGEDWDLDDEWQDDEAEGDTPDPHVDEPSEAPETEQDLAQSAEVEKPLAEDASVQDADDAAEKETAPVAPRRRELDPAVADVLRQEAAHEATVRATEEHETLETQTELGLGSPTSKASKRETEARSRMRRLRGLTTDAEPASEPEQTDIHESRESRRDLLPDIEETNSTLRHTGDSARPTAVDPAAGGASRSRGFRCGFVMVFLVAVAAVYVYSAHDSLGKNYPQFAPQIEGLVANVDGLRVGLDNKVTNLFLWMTEAASSGNAEQ